MQTVSARAPSGSEPADANMLARSVTLNIVGRIGSLLAGVAASVALTRYLGPDGRGLLGLMISASSLGLVFLTFGVPLSVVYQASRQEVDQGALLGNSLLQAAVLTAVIVPLAALLHKPLADALGEGHGGQTWVLVGALVPVTFLDWTTHGQLQGMLLFGRFNVLLVVSRVAYAVGVVVFVGVVGWGVAGGLVATAVGSVVMVIGSLRPILARARARLDRALLQRTF